MPNPFELFAQEVNTAAQNWPTIRPDLSAPRRGKPLAYEDASRVLHRHVASHPGVEALDSAGVAHGLSVMFRFNLVAAWAAAARGTSLEELGTALRHPDTYIRTLGMIASFQQDIAGQLETDTGVRTMPLSMSEKLLPYEIGTSVSIPLLGLRVRELCFDYEQEQEPLDSSRFCHAHRYLGRIYEGVTSITLQDADLIPATLEQHATPKGQGDV